MMGIEKPKIDFKLEAKRDSVSNTAVVYLYGDIVDEQPQSWWGGELIEGDYIFPQAVRDLIDPITESKIDLHINSYGGSVFASVAIFNYLRALRDKEITVYVDGVAASGAAIIAMVGTLKMPENTMLMVHRASSFGWGNCQELRDLADTLEALDVGVVKNTLKSKFNGSEQELEEILNAETWLNAQQAFDCGLCDEVIKLKAGQPEPEPKNQIMYNFAKLKI